MAYTLPQLLSFEEFVAQYGNNPRYELADGELIDMEPTGSHTAFPHYANVRFQWPQQRH